MSNERGSVAEAIAALKSRWEYDDIVEAGDLFGMPQREWAAQFFAGYNIGLAASKVKQSPYAPAEWSMVTGFGPTNAPTLGTISLISKAIFLQKSLGMWTDIVISDLGAWNSRRKAFADIMYFTEKLVSFVSSMGFDHANGRVRTHKDQEGLISSILIAKVFELQDFAANKEETEELYDALGLLGSKLGIYTDMLLTVGDILNPVINGKPNVLVVSGIEEHYFTRLASLARARLAALDPEFERIATGSQVGVFANVISGLGGFPKMSKSIPESAINLIETEAEIRAKIFDKANNGVIEEVIENCTPWSRDLKNEFKVGTGSLSDEARQSIYEYVISLKELWTKA